ncbi:long-chain fatty acid--CoA ligase [Gottfriedia sp. NPDC057991]|uniref:long-chain-fatty-acid--CoA ligase n=1 Tax=Gottfriedia sp. NPDC057991 TaxID=3346298 RepID=UPI0036D89900
MKQLVNRPWSKLYSEDMEVMIPEVPLTSILKETTKKYGSKTAIIFEQKEMTYFELNDQVDRLASAWQRLGLKKNERIGLMIGNSPDYIISYFAALTIGLTIVQINPMYTSRELLHIVSDSEVSYIVTDESALSVIDEVELNYDFKIIFTLQENKVRQDRKHVSLEVLKRYPNSFVNNESISAKDDVAVIQYTGGTSGKMKGAMLTHYNLIANVIQSCSMYGKNMVPGQEVILTVTPLYHVYAMTSAMNLGIYLGATILLFKKFNVENVLDHIKKYKPTFFPGVPKMYNTLVNFPEVEEFGLNCLKICSSGSAPLPIDVITRFEKLTGVSIGEGYGLSETSPTTHRNPPTRERKIGSIGIPLPGTDAMIVDEMENEVEIGQVGELLIKGPQVMKGYWNNEQETNCTLQDGWLHTGDLAMMDDEGYFFIIGRKKEMIIVGGFKIYPQEIENILYEHPDIKEAAVIGIPDYEDTELVKAYIVPNDSDFINIEEIKNYCYAKLTRYKVPKVFEIRDSLPRNTVGKLLKRILVQEEIDKKKEI